MNKLFVVAVLFVLGLVVMPALAQEEIGMSVVCQAPVQGALALYPVETGARFQVRPGMSHLECDFAFQNAQDVSLAVIPEGIDAPEMYCTGEFLADQTYRDTPLEIDFVGMVSGAQLPNGVETLRCVFDLNNQYGSLAFAIVSE